MDLTPFHVTYEMLQDFDLPFTLAESGDRNRPVSVELTDGTVTLRQAIVCFNLIQWYPLIKHQLPISVSDVDQFESFGKKAGAARMTRVYERLITAFPEMNHMVFIADLQMTVNRFSSFEYKFCGAFVQTIDVQKLIEIRNYPLVKSIIDEKVPDGTSINDTEQIYRDQAKRIIDVVTSGDIPRNALTAMLKAGMIRATSIPTMINAYGTRADPTGKIMHHHIPTGALEGWKSVADMAVESLSTRNTHLITVNTIPTSQYFFRKIRLATAVFKNLYPGDCGNRITLDQTIPLVGYQGFIGSAIYDGPNLVWLTDRNIEQYAGRKVGLVTSTTCRYQDGCCEHCYGWGWGRAKKYLAPECHIGTEAASQGAEGTTQPALGVKHNTGTDAEEFTIKEEAIKFFVQGSNSINLAGQHKNKLSSLFLRIPLESMCPLVDLDFDIETEAQAFSSITDIVIGWNDDDEYTVDMTSKDASPFLSAEFLEFVKTHKKNITVDETYLTVKLKGWEMDDPIFAYTVMSSDISAFINKISGFFTSRIKGYTSINKAFADLIPLMLVKSNIKVVFAQQMLRAFLLSPDPKDSKVPIITDPDNVMFGDICTVLARRSTTAMLAYERHGPVLVSPNTYLVPRQPTIVDNMFGFGEGII